MSTRKAVRELARLTGMTVKKVKAILRSGGVVVK